MKKMLLIAALATIIQYRNAQAQNAHEARITFQKVEQTAVVADYDLPKAQLDAALREKLLSLGLGKGKSQKGYLFFGGVNWSDISADKLDVYISFEGSGEKSSASVLLSKGYDNFISSATDPDKINRLQSFLNSFVKDARAYQIRQRIIEQEAVLAKAEKERVKIADVGQDLQKELAKVQSKIDANNSLVEKANAQTATENGKLAELKAQLNAVISQ
jgi:valyl-tRNA synthetase